MTDRSTVPAPGSAARPAPSAAALEHYARARERLRASGAADEEVARLDEKLGDLRVVSGAYAPAQQDFWAVLGWVRDRYGLHYYGLAARNGDMALTGGTIAHVHVHVIVGDPEGEIVRFKLSQPR